MRSLFFPAQIERGAVMGEYGPLELPAHYGDSRAEYEAVRQNAGLLDRSVRALILVTGSDRFSWLQGMVSNDLRLLEADSTSIQACILSTTGHLLSDLI